MNNRALTVLFLGLAITVTGLCSAQAIQWPRLGQPAIAVPGGLLEVSASEEGDLSLEHSGHYTPLDIRWTASGGGSFRGRAVLPEGLQPGVYALQLAAGKGVASNPAALHVLAAIPDDYAFAIYRGLESPEGPDSAPVIPADFAARLKDVAVQFAVVLGPLTRGTEVEYRALEAMVLASEVPVYLCPNRADLRSPALAAYAGAPVWGGVFGKDGLIFLGPGLYADDPRTAARLGEAYLWRRALRASRWSIGVAGEYGLDWELRAQEALFADDPLSLLIAGFSSPPLPELGAAIPWGKTALLPAADAPRGTLSIFEVNASGIRPRTSAPAPPAAPQEEAAGK